MHGVDTLNTRYSFKLAPIEVELGMMIEVSDYSDQFLKTNLVNLGYSELDKVKELVDRNKSLGVFNITSEDIVNTVPDIMTPSNKPIAKINIANGWREKRGVFFLKIIDRVDSKNSFYTLILQGFTNYLDVSMSGLLDPNTEFHINNGIYIHNTYNPESGRYNSRVIDTFSLVYQNDTPIMEHTNYNNELVVSRPEDYSAALAHKSILQTPGFEDEYNAPSDMPTIVPTSIISKDNHIAEAPVKVRKTDVNQLSMVKDILDNSINIIGKSDSNIYIDALYSSIMSSTSATSNNSINFFSNLSKLSNMGSRYWFTLGDLKRMDPKFNEGAINFIKGAGVKFDSVPMDAMLEENRIATSIINMITPVMLKNMLLSINMTVTNVTGEYDVIVTNATSFIEDVDLVMFVERVRLAVLREVLPAITRNNLLLIKAEIEISVLVDSFISISLNDGDPFPFVIPTFADNLFSSIISSRDIHDKNIDNIGTLVNEVVNTFILNEN